MNFKRIQGIFLIIFIAIDVFLFVFYNRSSVTNSDSSSGSNILEEMRKDQISFNKPANSAHEGFYFSADNTTALRQQATGLQQQSYRFDGTELVSEFKRTVTVPKGKTKKTLDKIVDNPVLVAFGDSYSYSKQLSTNTEVVYVQRVASGPVYSKYGQIRFTLNSERRVVGYSQNYLSDVKLLKEKTKTISEEKALTWLYQYNELSNGARVDWDNLAYTRLLTARGQYVFIPTWVFAIRMSGSSTTILKRVNAYTGEIIKTGSNNQSSNSNSEIFTIN
ncbi:hypothetical protein AYR62_13695 [Secundilactobacillus paracollinoides]|uniref:Regulatory protein YycH-like domain-containing protein n=1 Tax=Secundilactobacillus paracollinoides TaxID=240427 RepID=A0A1B2IWP5_9LACO|nr:two-component system regulatory protein YycI [Secundilactobacillus paracollinoides]ANZ60653.1 hypothetical protein AYR61_04390 [Secundilactobacillus paracollinoides]ANZ65026.1 hypothetical protein AYR62_13695 [Secundilactobacillus paracollinoides]ANZ66496.1 hypothetical protein AYR63_04675 [Secundilactobacillus paracollinoides]KRL78801.1 YycH protein [Secundilactobacillus paracollinoides DSM 15502 = JCM 11969]